MKKIIGAIAILALVASCTQKKEEEKSLMNLAIKSQQEFVDLLSRFCGQSFEGEQTFLAEGRESWADREMIVSFEKCTHEFMAIAVALGHDTSRTWMLIEENGRLRFRHDHRNVDGTPEEITLYGGYGNENGSKTKQVFPADEYTCQLLPNACQAEWVFELSQDLSGISYSLLNFGDMLFTAEFDLTRPLD